MIQVTKVWWDGEKLMAEPIDPTTIYQEPAPTLEDWGPGPHEYHSLPAKQEPAGWRPATFHRDNLTFNPGLPDEQTVKFWKLQGVEIEYCYTSPPAQRTWVGLTDEERMECFNSAEWNDLMQYAEVIEAKLRSKNT